MNYVSTKTVKSTTQVGASIVLKRMNDRRRQALAELQAPAVAKMKPLMEEFLPLNAEYGAAIRTSRAVGAAERKAAMAAGATEAEALQQHPYAVVEFDNGKFARWSELRAAIGKIERDEMEPAALRSVVVRIDDFTIDDVSVMTIDELLSCEDAPDDFRGEILRAVQRELGLLPEEVENLSSPSTSAAAVDGASLSGSAGPAGMPATITGADAGSSTGPASAVVQNIDSMP